MLLYHYIVLNTTRGMVKFESWSTDGVIVFLFSFWISITIYLDCHLEPGMDSQEAEKADDSLLLPLKQLTEILSRFTLYESITYEFF